MGGVRVAGAVNTLTLDNNVFGSQQHVPVS
jgi:hypothetical protein